MSGGEESGNDLRRRIAQRALEEAANERAKRETAAKQRSDRHFEQHSAAEAAFNEAAAKSNRSAGYFILDNLLQSFENTGELPAIGEQGFESLLQENKARHKMTDEEIEELRARFKSLPKRE